jgi:hypothetical protein
MHALRRLDEIVTTEFPAMARASGGVGQKEGLVLTVFSRSQLWVRTLRKLDHHYDFPALYAGARFLLEAAVDVALLHISKTAVEVERYIFWDMSSQLKTAQQVVGHFARKGRSSEAGAAALEFINARGKEIADLRKKHFGGRDKHPDRWTGRGLLKDAAEADRGCASCLGYLHGRLEDLVATSYGAMSASVHGAGFGLTRGRDDDWWRIQYDAMMVTSLRLGLASARTVVHEFAPRVEAARLLARLDALTPPKI